MGSLRIRPTRRARLRSGTTASSGMHHIASSCTSYTHVYLAKRGCRCSLVGPRRAPASSAGKTAGTIYTRNAYTLGKGELAWDTWPNHLVGRPSLQSGNETNDLLKSGPMSCENGAPPFWGPQGPKMLTLKIDTDKFVSECVYNDFCEIPQPYQYHHKAVEYHPIRYIANWWKPTSL